MRITRETLLKLAQDAVTQRTRSDRSVVGVYLHGSLLAEEPLLGGTTDIDLFFVHHDMPSAPREIVRITDDIQLDIAHTERKFYRQVRELRLHPWFGPTLYGCKILYDPQHFLDFIQASVRGQFERPDHVMGRSRPLLEQARRTWLSFSAGGVGSEIQAVTTYLGAVECAAQALALLSGPALTRRRFLAQFAQRAHALHRPELYAALLSLLHGTVELDAEILGAWLAQWEAAFLQTGENAPSPSLSAPRLGYYRRAFEALLYGETPLNTLWPLLITWTQLSAALPPGSTLYTSWQQAFTYLGLVGDALTDRLTALDGFLDAAEEAVEEWGRQNGI